MDPLIVFAIALAVFVLFILVTAYMLKSAMMFRSKAAGSGTTGKYGAEQDVTKDDEEPDK